MKLADRVTKMDLIMLLYKSVQNKEPGYGEMHKCAKKFQGILEMKYGITLGYKFEDVSIYDVWDNKFQQDIERYDVLGRVLDNSDILVSKTKNYYTHKLRLRDPEGEFLIKNISKANIEQQVGTSIGNLVRDITENCNCG